MSTIKHAAPESISSALTITIDSLTNGTYSGISTTEIDNSTGLYLFCDFWLELGATSITPTAGAFCGLYIIPTVDGTNYPTAAPAGTTSPGEGYFSGVFPLLAAAGGSQKSACLNVPIPPLKFKVIMQNNAGVTLSTSNTIKYRRHNIDVS